VIVRAWVDGCKRVVSAPALLIGAFAVTVALAVPLALTLRGALGEHLGSSLAADEAADAVNFDWWQEFESQAGGVGATFTPSIIGFAAVLENMSSVLDARRDMSPVAGAIGAYLIVWTFLSGGIIDRLARQRATRAHGFFAACGVFFFRFLRLAIVAALVYGFLFVYVHQWIFGTWYGSVTRDVAVERVAFQWRLAMYALFGALLVAVNVLLDYARIRSVVEDRRSMGLALAAAWRFIVRHPGRVLGLYALNALTFAAVIAIWALVAPGAWRPGARMWLAFAVAQLYIVARLFLKLHFLASQTALFQGSLAHAAYTAAPAPAWPESPAAEIIQARGPRP
jgi:hypothetical protein